jgi:hypothetical protein
VEGLKNPGSQNRIILIKSKLECRILTRVKESEKSDQADLDPDPHIKVMRSATLTDKIKYFEEID